MMAVRDFFKFSRKTFIDPTGWIDLDKLKVQNRTLWDVLSALFSIPKPVQEETFEEAINRLGLTEADVDGIRKNYRTYAFLFLMIGLITFFYTFYILFAYASYTGFIIGMAVAALFFSQAFRYDFWSFQIRRRQLGATFTEWKNSILGDKGSSS
jgi:hypothetical protein